MLRTTAEAKGERLDPVKHDKDESVNFRSFKVELRNVNISLLGELVLLPESFWPF